MNTKSFKKNVTSIMVSSAILLPTFANANIFDVIGGGLEDAYEWVEDDAVDWVVDTGEIAVNETENIGKIAINETGQFIDEAGNVITNNEAIDFLEDSFEISEKTGLAVLKYPTEKSEMFKSAMLSGDWSDLAISIKSDAIKIGAFAGAAANEIESGMENFGNEVGGAFEDVGKFVIDSEAMKQFGKGLETIRGALTECLASTEAVEDCYNQFVDMIVEFYNKVRYFVAKVSELKSFAKGAMYDEIIARIDEIERKSVKYFIPVLEENEYMLEVNHTDSPFVENSSVHDNFEQYASIQAIRSSLTPTNYSYHTDPISACTRVAIPIICDDYENLDNHSINHFNYGEPGISSSEQTQRKQMFHALNLKAFGSTYQNSNSGSRSSSDKQAITDYLQSQLYADINWSATDQRIPYIVENELLEGAGGAFIATDTDAIILLNEQLFADDNSLSTGFNDEDVLFAQGVALEEIGHWLNWRRCQYDNEMMGCAKTGETFGDPGLKFSNASFIEYNSAADYITQLANVTEGIWSKPAQLTLTNGDIAIYEGNPGLADLQDYMAKSNSKIRFRMRVQLGVSDGIQDVAAIGSTGIIEVNYTPPKRIKAGDLDDMGKYGFSNANQTLYEGNIGVNFAIENYVGSSLAFNSLIVTAIPTPIGYLPTLTPSMKVYGEVGIKSTFGISFPLLKEDFYGSGLTNINGTYRDNNIKLSYSVSPYVFGYQSLVNSLGKLSPVTLQLDQTASVWAGMTTSWPANTATLPISITMAGLTLASANVGCATGLVLFNIAGSTLSEAVECGLGAQIASGGIVSGAGYILSLFDPNITFKTGEGWVHGIRIKAGVPIGNASAGIETRFEALYSL